ncbi:NUDIX hydrolase [Flexithrix dorotheae]|uniref:NUDIX hydrolase n=1 Tax=Flexithrix dorotheae TaxID=70993 RepID=UPI0003658447|nr:CoA pyrophosphatase [Flexithrix dorotheae]
MINQFISQLQNRLKTDLPGKKAHDLMSSPGRLAMEKVKPVNPRVSAVLILLFPKENSIKLPLILRPKYDGVHSGQIAFPGGRREDEDHDIIDTALRETKEEIGVQIPRSQVIGKLSELYIPPSNSLVTPVVAYSKNDIKYEIDRTEVDQVFDVPLNYFKKPENKKMISMNVRGLKFVAPSFQVAGQTVWGATAMMISELVMILNESND